MVSLMRDERDDLLSSVIKLVLLVLSWIYGAAVAVVSIGYRSGIRKMHKAPVPVVSVGNITLGGTGKTPFTILVAEHFCRAGKKPAVLTRGYGGDESVMLKDELPEVPVFVGQDRERSAGAACSRGRDILILDDGFQHRRLARDLDILLVDGVEFFGNGDLFPRGTLREPVSSLSRADMFVLTKTDRIGAERKKLLIKNIGALAPGKPIVMTRHKPTFLSDTTGSAFSPYSLRGKKICIMSGIGDPDYFAFLFDDIGADIVARRDYSDHYRYTQTDISRWRSLCSKTRAEAVVVTKKDYVKIRSLDLTGIEEKLFVLNVVIEVTEGKEKLIAGLNSVIVRNRV